MNLVWALIASGGKTWSEGKSMRQVLLSSSLMRNKPFILSLPQFLHLSDWDDLFLTYSLRNSYTKRSN